MTENECMVAFLCTATLVIIGAIAIAFGWKKDSVILVVPSIILTALFIISLISIGCYWFSASPSDKQEAVDEMSYVFCPYCGKSHSSTEKYQYCPKCGQERDEDQNYCSNCGYEFSDNTVFIP